MSKQELKENDICRVVDIAKCDGYYPIKEHFIGKKVRLVYFLGPIRTGFIPCYVELLVKHRRDWLFEVGGYKQYKFTFFQIKLEKVSNKKDKNQVSDKNRNRSKKQPLMCLDGETLCEPSKKPRGYCNQRMCGG